MSHINIRRNHTLSLTRAREAADLIADQLDEKFQLHHHWQGDTLHFKRSGVDGHIDVDESEVRIHARLSFLLTPLKSRFEQAIHRYMDELFVED